MCWEGGNQNFITLNYIGLDIFDVKKTQFGERFHTIIGETPVSLHVPVAPATKRKRVSSLTPNPVLGLPIVFLKKLPRLGLINF